MNTIYDMASLTKVIATTTAAMILEEQGQLDLDRSVASYLPEFNAPDKAGITMRMVMTHRGGLEAFAALYKTFSGREQYLQQINLRPLKSVPGTEMVYSDWDMILTQLVIEKITGMPLDRFVDEKVFRPLGMKSTMFTPDSSLKNRIAPTEIDTARGGLVWGKGSRRERQRDGRRRRPRGAVLDCTRSGCIRTDAVEWRDVQWS